MVKHVKFQIIIVQKLQHLIAQSLKICKINRKQAVAELGQTQVKLEVVNDVVVKVRS